jgi:acetyl-CoA acetyltransferase
MGSAHVTASAVGRVGKRPEGLLDLLTEVGLRALEGVGRRPIDLLVVGTMVGGSLAGVESVTAATAERLGLDPARGYRIEAASATGAAAFHVASSEVMSGRSKRALVVAGEKMTGLPTEEVTRVLARSLHPTEQAVGATMPALAAIVAQRYMTRHEVDPAAFDAVTVLARQAARGNPNAQFPTPVSREEVSQSRWIAPPLKLLHCSAISDGAAAVVVEEGSGEATVLGLGQGFDAFALMDRNELTSFRATRLAAQRAYEMAGITRKEVQFAELHDAFAPFALVDLEDIGMCGAGEAGKWFLEGATSPEGRFPVNPSGGLLGRGHPVGATGLIGIAEVARQLTGEAGPLALPKLPNVGVAQSIGGLASHNFVTILGRGTGERA